MDRIEELEKRLERFIARQAEMEQDLADTQQLLDQLKRKQIKSGPLGPLAQALAYHHEMVQGWVRLVEDGRKLECTPENMERLYAALARMYGVVTQYEYVSQILLGINPSPFADLEDKK